MNNDDDSSEGIIASSDDEYDGLSRAVEYHIFNEQSLPARNDEFWRMKMQSCDRRGSNPHDLGKKPPSPYLRREMFPHPEGYRHLDDRNHLHGGETQHRLRRTQSPPYSHPVQYYHESQNMAPARQQHGWYQRDVPIPYMRHHIPELNWRPEMNVHPRIPCSERLQPPLVAELGPLDSRNKREWHHHPARNTSSPHFLFVNDTDHRMNDTDLRTHRSRVPKPIDACPNSDPNAKLSEHSKRVYSHDDRNVNRPPQPHLDRDHPCNRLPYTIPNDHSRLQYENSGGKPEKLHPKPVSFKIKSSKTEEMQFHPLDRLAPLSEDGKSTSPSRWLHDKYEDEDKESEPTEKVSGQGKDGLLEDGKTSPVSDEFRTTDKSPTKEGPNLQLTESPEGLIHAEKEDDTLYEVEEVVIEEVEAADVHRMNESSEEDEELLGLRFKALSSALRKDNKARNTAKKRSSARKKKLKNLIHRVPDSPQSQRKNSVQGKRSAAVESFLGKRSSAAKQLPITPKKSRLVKSKNKPAQLTLLGEMVKNYHPSKLPDLKKIKSKPDIGIKSSRNARSQTCKKLDAVQASEAKATEAQNDAKPNDIGMEKNLTSEYLPSMGIYSKKDLMDNYDEMEMELEGQDGGSDSGLLPPGVDQSESAKASVPHIVTAIGPLHETSEGGIAQNATPSQESIWSMLEHNILPENDSNVGENKDEQQKIEKIITLKSRRESFDDFDDDDAILKLRQSLLRQLDQNVKKDTDCEELPAKESKPAPLPSQFPYKPPELKIVSSLVSTDITSVPEVPNPTLEAVCVSSAAACMPTASAVTVSNTSITKPEVAIPIAYQGLDPCAVSTKTAFVEDTGSRAEPIANAVSGELPLFLQTAKRQDGSKESLNTESSVSSSEKLVHIDHAGELSEQLKSNVLKSALANVGTMPKPTSSSASKDLVKTLESSTFHPQEPMTLVSSCLATTPTAFLADTTVTVEPSGNDVSVTTPRMFLPQTVSTPALNSGTPALQKRRKRRRSRNRKAANPKIAPASAHKLSEADCIGKTIVQQKNVLKPSVTNVGPVQQPSGHPAASRTLVKTATTIIRSTARHPKKLMAPLKNAADSPTKDAVGRIKSSNEKPMSVLRLPRHQPVVVNLGSSDEEDSSIVSPAKTAVASVQRQRDKLTEMIKQVRMLTTVKQNAVIGRSSDGNKNSVGNSVQTPESFPPEKLKQTSRNSPLNTSTSQTLSPNRHLDKEISKKLRTRFLKFRALIEKDEMKIHHVRTAKETKESELKAVEDELKQMMYRIAAIKSKRTRCEELLKRYSQQESVIKNRLQKRKAEKLKLVEKLKSHWINQRNSQAMPQFEKKAAKIPVVKPVADTAAKLDREKQRLLAKEQRLAETISKMKKPEAAPISGNRKRSALSNEVQSHLAKYRRTRKTSNPSAHDLSLNKIVISGTSPARHSSPRSKKNGNAEKKIEAPAESSAVTELDGPKVDEGIEKSSVSDASMKLRLSVKNSIKGYEPFASYDPILSYEAEPFAPKFWETPVPDWPKKWKFPCSVISVVSTVKERQVKGLIDMTYESPLRTFRSYRLSPYLRVKEKLSVKSLTFSHKMDPARILCRYDLSGKCHDPDCRGQHSHQYQLSADELILDLLLYSPSMLGERVTSDMQQDSLIEKAKSAYHKIVGSSPAHKNMSIDDKCILIASKVNSTLGNKSPFTIVFEPRPIKLDLCRQSHVAPLTVRQESVEMRKINQDDVLDHPDLMVEHRERYFGGRNEVNVEQLESAVTQNPQCVQLWLELTQKRLKAKDANRLELALHTMCLALEENPYSGELWAYYLDLLHARKSDQSGEDLDEMVSQAIHLVPLSTTIWNLLLSWDCNSLKMVILLDQLISNIVKSTEEPVTEQPYSPEFMSGWLLESVLRKMQLFLYRNDIVDALEQFSCTINSFTQQRIWATQNSAKQCLMPNDFSILKLCYLNVKYFKCLPRCFLLDIRPTDSTQLVHAVKVSADVDVQLHFSSNSKLDQQTFASLLDDLDVAIQECKVGDEVNMVCFALLWEKLRLLRAHECWDGADSLCRLILKKVQCALAMDSSQFGFTIEKLNRISSDTTILLADCLAKNGEIHEATQVFENAINDNKTVDGQLCFEAALLQSTVDSGDIEAVLVYLEAFISSFFKSEPKCLDANSLKFMSKYLLRLPLPLEHELPDFADGVSWTDVNKEKASVWLMYCLLLQVTGSSDAAVCECYEQAIDDVLDSSGRKELWLRYIRFKQALSLSLPEPGVTKSGQQQRLNDFNLLVKRCLTTTSHDLSSRDGQSCDNYSDYTFHNQVAALYLNILSTRKQTASAYNFLTNLMPYNSLLILRACKFHWTNGDHRSVISSVWKITTNTRSQNETLWKISISSHFLSGRIAKAVRLAKQAVESVPFSYQLWSDYLTLLKAYGLPTEFVEEKVRCSNMLQVDASRLIAIS